MKRKARCLFLLVCCCFLLLSLCGCGGPSPVGTWNTVVPYADLPDAGKTEDDPELDLSGLSLQLDLDLRADGSFDLYTDQASLDHLLEDLKPLVADAALKEMCKKYDVTEAEAEARLEELGLDMDKLVEQFFEELDSGSFPARRTGTYRLTDDTLYLSGADGKEYAYRVSLTETDMTIQAPAEQDGMGFGPLLPLDFQRNP